MRSRHPDESIAKYLAELRTLSEHCNYQTTLNDMLRDRVVTSLLLSEGETLTLEKATTIPLSMESAIAQANEIQTYQQQRQVNDAPVNQLTPKSGRSLKKLDCYRCGGNHLPDTCQVKDKVCFYCRIKGHS